MFIKVYWIEAPSNGHLGIMPRPRGGDWLEDEIQALCMLDTHIVVSLLTRGEEHELDLSNESTICKANNIEFIALPVPDRGVPTNYHTFLPTVQYLGSQLHNGQNVVIHCRMGIGRAALLAASVLAQLNMPVDVAFDRISKARGCPVPDTPEQQTWVAQFTRFTQEQRG